MSIPEHVKILSLNRRARFDYSVEESLECGIELKGSEVKSIKEGRFSFPDSYADLKDGQVWLKNFHVNEYVYSSVFGHDPDRPKRLLLHRQEIKRIDRRVREKGYTLIPLSFYLKKGLVKVELGLCKGKKAYDKRAVIKERDMDREIRRDFKSRQW
ncbi:MAG: SsrA-binding protein SmpB [Spirochaetia bacterium]|jgi:SsrA-binding protein|nr:SsrA-binding protein SmpB [Spirochaetales bacterium]MDX9783660.1 SsrA-binding protein SmpB [Spirochaetia bacterium]